MGRLGLSFKAFFRILSDGTFAERVQALADGKALAQSAAAQPAPAAHRRDG